MARYAPLFNPEQRAALVASMLDSHRTANETARLAAAGQLAGLAPFEPQPTYVRNLASKARQARRRRAERPREASGRLTTAISGAVALLELELAQQRTRKQPNLDRIDHVARSLHTLAKAQREADQCRDSATSSDSSPSSNPPAGLAERLATSGSSASPSPNGSDASHTPDTATAPRPVAPTTSNAPRAAGAVTRRIRGAELVEAEQIAETETRDSASQRPRGELPPAPRAWGNGSAG